MTARTVALPVGDVTVGDVGDGPPVLFAHGVLVNGSLWSDVVHRLSGARCLTPDLPLGGHRTPARPGADLSPRALAAVILDIVVALDLRDVTLVGNDSGGGLCLIALDLAQAGVGHPGLERISRLVLTNCDSYEHFPPKAFAPMCRLSRRAPRAMARLVGGALRTEFGRKRFLASVSTAAYDRGRAAGFFDPVAADRAVRRDAVAVMGGLEPSATLGAAEAIGRFPGSVLLAWGDRCRFFPVAHAERLAAAFRDARLEVVPGSSTYVPLDAPDRLAGLVAEVIA